MGEAAPALGESDYTVSGLASGDVLLTKPTIAYQSTPDMSKPGEVAILVSGAAVIYNNYNDIVYQPGTLTISQKSNGGGGTGGGNSVIAPPKATKPNAPATAERNIMGKTDQNGKATATATEKYITAAIENAQKATGKNAAQNIKAITLNVKTDKAAKALELMLPKKSIDALIAANVTQLIIQNDLSTVTLDLAALKALAGGEVKLTVSKVDVNTLSPQAQTAIGSRPVFQYSITSGGKAVTDFKGGRVGLQMAYMLAATEQAGNLCGVYVDANGKVNWVEASSYDPITGTMQISTQHFSIYGIGYKQDTPKFTDIANHWAKNDIDFVVARGLINGISNTTFAPTKPSSAAHCKAR